MDYGRPANRDEEQQCIDPRLLLAGSGGGVDDPNYNLSARPPVTEDVEFDLEQDLNPNIDVFIQDAPTASPGNGAGDIQDTQAWLRSRPSTLRPEAAAFVPRRPRLTLQTDVPSDAQPPGTTPTTPEIRVSAPGNTTVHEGVVPWQTGLERRRARRNSSPARRHYARTSGRIGRPIQVFLSPGSPPSSLEAFVIQDSYHPGDRFTNRTHAPPFQSPTSAPRSVPPPPSTVSSNPRRNSSGQYPCNYPDCTEAKKGKAFDTPNELRKHQRKHIPEEHRPHGCDRCPRRFLFPKDLQRHMKTHESFTEGQEDDRPRCLICEKPLSRDDNLSRHMLQIHGVTTPSSSGRGPRHADYASPSPESTRSFSVYSGSRPASRIGPIPDTNARLQQVLNGSGAMIEGPFTNLSFVADPTSPSHAPPMARSRSDIH